MMFQNIFLNDDEVGNLDPEIKSLVLALNSTGVLKTMYSCEGHFSMSGSAFCHHNQKAQVAFYVDNLVAAAKRCNQILDEVIFEGLEVCVKQNVLRDEDGHEIQWSLEYRPIDLWEIKPQDGGVYICMNAKWTEKNVRKLLRRAFDATIKICEAKEYLETRQIKQNE